MGSASDRLEVKATHLGRALFATFAFEAEELLGEVVGTIIDDPDYSSDYSVDLGRSAVLEPAEPFRFLNHSCEPNCELIRWQYRRFNKRRYYRVWLQTLRTIAAGEELTIDYCWPASAAIPCSCQSSKCRGWIVNPEELDQLLVTRGRDSEFQVTARRQLEVSLASPV
jgi:hypothetical protein